MTSTISVKTLIFDIDGTLILSGGAGMRALDRAFAELFGINEGFACIPMAGRIDPAILRSALDKHELPVDGFDALVPRFCDAYCRHLVGTLRESTTGHVLPGVSEILSALHSRDDIRLGLATGNWRRGAELKLRHYGLWDYFCDGGFGEDCEDRADLVSCAMQRLMRDGDAPESGYVIGDTVFDVAAAKANGAIAIAVNTGVGTTYQELAAAKPHFLFADFSDWQSVIERLGL